MLATLEHLKAKGDQALVRGVSDEWFAESDVAARHFFQETRDLDGRIRQRAPSHLQGGEPLIAVRTATVRALVGRGLLKYVGAKRKVISGAARKDYARAELTAAAAGLVVEMEQQARSAYEALLRRLETGPEPDLNRHKH